MFSIGFAKLITMNIIARTRNIILKLDTDAAMKTRPAPKKVCWYFLFMSPLIPIVRPNNNIGIAIMSWGVIILIQNKIRLQQLLGR